MKEESNVIPRRLAHWLELPRLPILIAERKGDGALLRHANRAMEQLTGRHPTAFIGQPVEALLSPQDTTELERLQLRVVTHAAPLTLTLECQRPDGSTFWGELWLAAVDTADGDTWLLGLMRDITLQRLDQARLERRAINDPLTGLYNRSHFLDALRRMLPTLPVTGTGVAVLFIDLDDFKPINDRHGHAVGDTLLVTLAQRLAVNLRASDLAARFGGDEFVVAYSGITEVEQARQLAERLFAALREPLDLAPGITHHLGASLGLAFTRDPRLTPAELVEAADRSMYQAKHQGKNRLAVADALQSQQHSETSAPLIRALQSGEIHLRFQPVVNLARGATVGFEALPHWQHPDQGLLGPEHFLHLADDSTAGQAFNRWLIHEGAALSAWFQRQRFRLGIGINLTRAQIETSTFLENLHATRELFDDGRVDLTLEIVESIQFDDTTLACAVLQEARELGVQIVLDDFGSGVSSLTYANRMPLDIIKLHPDVTRHIDQRTEQRQLVIGLIAMAHATGRLVAAGGVERPQEVEILKRLGCDFVQGPVFATPLTLDALHHTYLTSKQPPPYPLRRFDA